VTPIHLEDSPDPERCAEGDLTSKADGDELRVNAPNCVDCKATDVLGPRWTAREGGSGPAYRRM